MAADDWANAEVPLVEIKRGNKKLEKGSNFFFSVPDVQTAVDV